MFKNGPYRDISVCALAQGFPPGAGFPGEEFAPAPKNPRKNALREILL
jgi:hypothetical protein